MEIKKLAYIFILPVLVHISCKSERSESEPEKETTKQEFVVLSEKQIAETDIQVTKLKKHLLSETITCTGKIEADPNQKALVSPTMKAYLKHINVHVGDYVRKGQTLAMLAHPYYIKLQQEYFETLSQYAYYQQDFKRQGELSLENAASLKTMQKAQNEFRKTEAQLFSLKKQLEFLGIDTDSLNVDKIRTSIALPAPISGYVTKIEGKIGMLCPEEIPIFHLVGSKNLMLELKVFEKDAAKIRPKQEFNFVTLSAPEQEFTAQIKSVAWALDESNTVSVHAHFKNPGVEIMPGMFIKAIIQTNPDSVWAVPEEALVKLNTHNYIFAETHAGYKPIKVSVGRNSKGLVEISSEEPSFETLRIVSQGAYYIYSEWIED